MRTLALLASACSVAAAIGCAAPRRELLPVALPELARVDPGVQAQLRERYETLQRSKDAASYGQYGMVLQAAEYSDAAEPCYLNAQQLDPSDVRWPYYLAKLYKSRGETDKAEAAFRRALELQPNDLATLIWLARLNLDQGKPDAAEPLFAKAYSLAPRTAAAVAGLGRVAVAKRDYTGAIKYLEEALVLDPEAESLHAPLATAYRGLGQEEKARPHVGQWRNGGLPVPDPRQQDMDLLLESGLSYELRGIRAFETRDWKSAMEFFRKGVALSHANTALSRSLHHKLGTALFLSGDVSGAQDQFEAVVREQQPNGIDEATAKAHYSLGLILDEKGQHQAAVEHLAAAVKYQPTYVEAHLAYADELRRVNNFALALAQYAEATTINPRSVPARLGSAITLVALGRSRDALDSLTSAVMLYPDRLEYKSALARLLAAAPDDHVRDAKQALAIIDRDFGQQRTTDIGETLAMALAAVGDFDQAVSIQRAIMSSAEGSGLKVAAARMAANLRLYLLHQSSRRPWSNDQPVVLSE